MTPFNRNKRSSEPSRTVSIDPIGTVTLKRSHLARHLRIAIRPTLGIVVTAPKHVSEPQISAFVRHHADWIAKRLDRIRAMQERLQHLGGPISLNLADARVKLTARAQSLAQTYGFHYRRLTFRNQRTRWGSCSGKNHISLNIKLGFLPDALVDYVILHELVHTRIKSHRKEFWDHLMQLMPDAKFRRQNLRDYDGVKWLDYPNDSL